MLKFSNNKYFPKPNLSMKGGIDPWGSAEIGDYGKVFKEFGLENYCKSEYGLDYLVFRRGIAIAHRDFGKVYERMKSGKPFINMTGIASSGPLHFGHKLIVDIFRFFKENGGKNYFGICDIDAFVSRPKIKTLKEAQEYAAKNLADILAMGLSEKDIYLQSKKEARYYTFSYELSKKLTENMIKAVYGTLDPGKISANLLQYADILHGQLPEYEGNMPSVTAIALEQDPHLRVARDLARRLKKFELPSSIYITHQPGLTEKKKMSSSEPDTAIFLDDTPKAAEKKIMRAFTGGRDTIDEQKNKGGKPDVCKVYSMLRFHHPDDKKLLDICERCRKGELMCEECKRFAAEFVSAWLEKHREKREKVKAKARDIVLGE